MKIALACNSILVEKSLRKFLKGNLVTEYEADILVSDHIVKSDKPVLRIGMDEDADLRKPFSRSQLMIKLEEKLQQSANHAMVRNFTVVEEENETLEEKIERITRIFIDDLTAIIKEHYEAKR